MPDVGATRRQMQAYKSTSSETGLETQLITIERKLWTNDAVFYKNSVIQEAVLVFPETGAITRDVAVDAILTENAEGRRWAEVEFQEIRSLRLGDDVALLTYRVAARWEHQDFTNPTLASSVYTNRDGVWKLAFHQQTPI